MIRSLLSTTAAPTMDVTKFANEIKKVWCI